MYKMFTIYKALVFTQQPYAMKVLKPKYKFTWHQFYSEVNTKQNFIEANAIH